MALVHQALSIPDAIDLLRNLIQRTQVKNNALIGFYIYPDRIPSEIEAFIPRVNALADRVASVDSISITNLSQLLNDAPVWVACHLLSSVDQLKAAVGRFEQIFTDHYDDSLYDKAPYETIYRTLEYIAGELNQYEFNQTAGGARHLVAELSHLTPSMVSPSFCRSAVAFINGQDRGDVAVCQASELTSQNKLRIRDKKGVYLWWECPSCAFRLRFHVAKSSYANINTTDEIRSEPGLQEIEYRSSLLVKSHLHHVGRDQQRNRRRSSTASSTSLSIIRSPRSSGSSIPINTSGIGGVKYGCLFCYANGLDLEVEETCFGTAREYIQHLLETHNLENRPDGLLLQKFHVGIQGRTVDNGRWDVNFL